jgi:hypothetical protein
MMTLNLKILVNQWIVGKSRSAKRDVGNVIMF